MTPAHAGTPASQAPAQAPSQAPAQSPGAARPAGAAPELAQLMAGIESYRRPLQGARLPAATLPAVLGSQPMVILHFLRHLGCAFCKHSVDQLAALYAQAPHMPPILFVHQSPVEAGEAFFAQRFPGAAHISDPGLELYQLFGIQRMRPSSFLNPGFLWAGLLITLRGYFQGPRQGSGELLTGTFVFRQGRLVWQHRARVAGEEPNWRALSK